MITPPSNRSKKSIIRPFEVRLNDRLTDGVAEVRFGARRLLLLLLELRRVVVENRLPLSFAFPYHTNKKD